MSIFKDINVAYVYVADLLAAKKFYQDVLGWPVAFESDEAGWIEFGGEGMTHFAINRWDDPATRPPVNGGATITFSVANAQQAVDALRLKGVKCEDAFTIPGMVSYASFYDPEGNRLQMASPPPA
jgi:predicted enzyme related to lactoylglutathione lyase